MGGGKATRVGAPCADALLISRAVGAFLREYAPLVLGRSEHTVRGYARTLSLYADFLSEGGVTPSTLSREHLGRAVLEEWVAWMRDVRGNSNDTVNVRIGSMRAFLEYLGTLDVSLAYLHVEARLVRRLRPDGAKVGGMSRDAVEALLRTPDTSTAAGRRDVVLLSLLYTCAVRVGEARSLTWDNVHLDCGRAHIVVRGKGGKVRTCFLTPKTAALLRAWRRESGPQAYVFPSKVTGGMLSETAIDKRVKLHASKAREVCPEVPERAFCHMLRHAKASHLTEDGMNIYEVQLILGHASPATTARYIDVSMGLKADALATIAGEREGDVPKRWKSADGRTEPTLAEFLRLR